MSLFGSTICDKNQMHYMLNRKVRKAQDAWYRLRARLLPVVAVVCVCVLYQEVLTASQNTHGVVLFGLKECFSFSCAFM